MKAKYLFLILFLPCFLFSQSLEQRLKTEKSFIVHKNSDTFLPLIRLDTLKIAVKNYGGSAEIFYKSALRYTEIDTTGLKKSNLLIFLLFDQNYNEAQLIDSLSGKDGIVLSFGGNFFTEKIKTKAKAVISTPLIDSLTQDYAAQLIFGAFSVEGINGGIRFKYTIPQEVGLDSSFIFSKVDSIALKGIELQAYPGCVVFAAVDQKVIFYKSYGYHTYENIVKTDIYDIFDLASVTKIAATVPCLMLLYQQEKFDLNDRISDYYPPFRHSNKKYITFIDALTHQARLKSWIPFWKVLLLKNDTTFKKNALSTKYSKKYSIKVADNLYLNRRYKKLIFREIKKSPLYQNKSYKYSDLAFYIFPLIIEKLSGESFEKCLTDNFYKKLSMPTTMFNPLRKYSCKQIVPTEYDNYFRRQLLCGYVDDEGAAMLGGVSGHAGLFSNANDLAKLMQMYCNYGKYGGIKYFYPFIVKKWTSYQFTAYGNRRAIGFDKPLLKNKHLGTPSPYASGASFGHSGFTGTFVWADPTYNFVFIFLSNRIYPDRSHYNLLKYNIRPSIHSVFYQEILRNVKY